MHLTGRDFSGIFPGVVEIKRSLTPKHIIITCGIGECIMALTVEDQVIQSGVFDTPKVTVWPKESK